MTAADIEFVIGIVKRDDIPHASFHQLLHSSAAPASAPADTASEPSKVVAFPALPQVITARGLYIPPGWAMAKVPRSHVAAANAGQQNYAVLRLHGRRVVFGHMPVDSVSRAWEHYRATTPNP
eukprot:1855382-Prymnesium_polylepis.1